VISKEQESELIEKIKKGNTAAFGEFVSMYENTIANVVIGMLGNSPEAEDVAQDVFIKFFYNVHNFREESRVKTYLTRIAINLSLNELKKRNLQKERMEFREDLKAYEGKSFQNPDSFDLKEIIEAELQKLEKGQRAVFVLRMIEGFSTKETAKILKIPQGTVLSRLHRTMDILKERLKEFKYTV
jgi:RNA polymerase sigma-70 factor (ECF subfamily)